MRASLRLGATRWKRGLSVALVGGACLAARPAVAADKAAGACIQAAEDGERARKVGALLRARELFARCAARECPSVLRRDCAAWLEETEREVPSIVLGARDAQGRDVVDARAKVDGVVVREHLDGNEVALDPGSHVVRFERAGSPAVEIPIMLRAGEKNRPVLATLGAAPPPAAAASAPAPSSAPPSHPDSSVAAPRATEHPHVPVGAWVLGGMSAVAFADFAYFGVSGMNAASTLRSTCAPGCTDPQVKAVRAKLIAADVGLGVGVVSLAAAVWIAVRGLTPRETAAWDVVVAPSPAGARAGVVVAF